MKKISAVLVAVLLACCDPAPEKKEGGMDQAAEIPPGAIREKFSDDPSLEKITHKDAQGHLQTQGILKNGKKDGTWIDFDPRGGLVKATTSWVDGNKEGISIELNSTGQLQKRISWHHNLRHGEYREYLYSNIKEERFYQNDRIEGVVKTYYDNGKPMEEGTYKNGTRDGISRWYDQNGNVSIEYRYKNGELVK